MLHKLVSAAFRLMGGTPAFQVYGRGRREPDWHIIDIYATSRRNQSSRLPLFRGTCITWSANVISVGWDFAEGLVAEQALFPASRQFPVEVCGGRLHDPQRRTNGNLWPTLSEIMAHECGHTAQGRKMGLTYWPVGGSLTLFREGKRPWNYFENQASEIGLFGGIVTGSVCERLKPWLKPGNLFGIVEG